MNNVELERRLIDFALMIITIVKSMPEDLAANHLANQLVRSGTSVALNYGEAQGAESKRDFIHKMRVILKELRESLICLKLILGAKLYKNQDSKLVNRAQDECNQLVSIFVASIKTAGKNLKS